MATTLDGQSESEKKTLSILIPSCLESNFTIDYCGNKMFPKFMISRIHDFLF